MNWSRTRDAFNTFGTLFAVVLASTAVIINSGRVTNLQQGRAVSLDVTCAAISALIDGGRTAIHRSAARPGDTIIGDPNGRFTVRSGTLSKFLEAHGLPGPDERVQNARVASAAYALDTAAGIAAVSGRADLVQPDGRLDCTKLRKAAEVSR